jgi:hypothetical protein
MERTYRPPAGESTIVVPDNQQEAARLSPPWPDRAGRANLQERPFRLALRVRHGYVCGWSK